jgi:hypothetical protein
VTKEHFWFAFTIFVLLALAIKFIFDPGWVISLGISFGITAGVWFIANSDEILS